MNDIELIDEIVKRAEEYQKQKEKEFAVTELEKIKQMILERQGLTCDCNCNRCGWFPCADVYVAKIVKRDIEILDKRIAELKGE